ncbi:MAG: hypothetical protein AAFN41_06220, partial [Planctomycetota bacterium]
VGRGPWRVVGELVPSDDAVRLQARLERETLPIVPWLGDSNMSAQEWLDETSGDESASAAQDAVCITLTCLRRGVRAAAAIYEAAQAQGVSEATLKRATANIGIVKANSSFGWLWGWGDERRDDVIRAHCAATPDSA